MRRRGEAVRSDKARIHIVKHVRPGLPYVCHYKTLLAVPKIQLKHINVLCGSPEASRAGRVEYLSGLVSLQLRRRITKTV